MGVPHPFPYQGSKRAIAGEILKHMPKDVDRIVEPFCGSAALSIAAACRGMGNRYWLNDMNRPLVELWTCILDKPWELAYQYEQLWLEQQGDSKAHFYRVRDEFNRTKQPQHLLYLLARIVKGSIRYSPHGTFNQSADNRRSGMRPSMMRRQIVEVAQLLQGKVMLSALDFRQVIESVETSDVVYMDPPYQGTSSGSDRRYLTSVDYDEFAGALSVLNSRDMSYIISYDGQTGGKVYGSELPPSLGLSRILIQAGRSTQATLLGRSEDTIESLYLSPALVRRIETNHYDKVNQSEPPRNYVLL